MSTTHSVHAHLRTTISIRFKRANQPTNEPNETKAEATTMEKKVKKKKSVEFKTELRFLRFIRLATSLYTGHSLSEPLFVSYVSAATLSYQHQRARCVWVFALVLVLYPSLKIKILRFNFSVVRSLRIFLFLLFASLPLSFCLWSLAVRLYCCRYVYILGPHVVYLTAKHIPIHTQFRRSLIQSHLGN